MKTVRTTLAALFLLLFAQTALAADYDGTVFKATSNGLEMQFQVISVSNKTCRVCGGWDNPSISSTRSGSISIPYSAYSGSATYTVIEVGYCAFSGCKYITSVTLPSSVKTIGDYAFRECEALTSINLYNTETIGYYSFWGCKSLKTFPSGGSNLKEIGTYAFYECEKLESVNLPYNLKKIGFGAFGGCKSLTSFTGGSNLNEIDDYAFRECEKLETISLPNNVKTIGSEVFYNCKALKSFSGGNSLTTVGTWAFDNCENLTTVTFPLTLTSIGSYAFYNCKALTTINGLANVEYIGNSSVFYNTPWYNALPNGQIYIGKVFFKYKGTIPEGTTINIKEGTKGITGFAISGSGVVAVTIPQSVTNIGEPFLSSCSNLNSISVASGNSTYDSRGNCNAVIKTATNNLITGCNKTVIPNTVTSLGYEAFYGCSFTDVVIPDKVDSIANLAFIYCSKLKSVTMGKGVRKIVNNPFWYCYSLENIIVSTGNPYFDSRNNCKGIVEKATNTLRVGTANTVIPSSVTTIGYGAFLTCNNGNLLTYTIPNHIGKIENYAFEDNSNIRSVTIGKGVKEMGTYVFYGCTALTAIHSLIDFPFEIKENVFSNSTYETATLYVPIGSRASYMMTPGWNKFKNIVETNGSTAMKGDVFSAQTTEGQLLYYQVTSTTDKTCELVGVATNVSGKITIPSVANGFTVTAIGNRAFYNYSYLRNITEIVVPETVKSIGEYAFYYCQDMKKINIPSGVTSIARYTFYYCKSLESISIPNGVTSIGTDAFYRCEKLTSIKLPASLESIGSWAFGFLSIESVSISKSITSIGLGAFGGCKNLNSIIVASDNQYYDSRNNCNAIIDKSTRTLIAGCKTTIIPNTVESIGKWAFSNHKELANITIPNSVAVIDSFAFARTAMTDLIIPASVRSIAYQAFCNCDNLQTVTSQIEVPTGIPENVFVRADDVPSFYETGTLYVPYGTKTRYSETDGWSLFKNIVEREGTNKRGDVSGDFVVNGTDLVMLANIILEKSPETEAADLNGDKKVNGIDYVTLVNIVLAGGNASRSMTPAAQEKTGSADIYIEPFAVNAGGTCEMLIGLRNPDVDITLMQFDLHLPNGLSVKTTENGYDMDMAGRTSWQSHSLNANATDGGLRFLLCSMSNALVQGSEGAVIRLTLQADSQFDGGMIELENILSVSPSLQEFSTPHYYYQVQGGDMTNIKSVGHQTNAQIYSLSGQRLATPRKGINVIGGKKLMVK